MNKWVILLLAGVYFLIALGAICISSPRFGELWRWLVSRRSGRRPIRESPGEERAAGGLTNGGQVGEVGVTQTLLDPVGQAWFGPELVEVVSEEGEVEAGTVVRIVSRDGERLWVRPE